MNILSTHTLRTIGDSKLVSIDVESGPMVVNGVVTVDVRTGDVLGHFLKPSADGYETLAEAARNA